MRYIALLRGINVGGKNVIKMVDLKACFEKMGFTGVVTYIQSGNVLFDATEIDRTDLVLKIEADLSQRFNYASKIVVISQPEIYDILKAAPHGFGSSPEEYRYDVIFLRKPLTPADVLNDMKVKDGVDVVTAGNQVLYFSRLSSMSSQSQMTKMLGTPAYREMTIRNWNTSLKLAEL